MNKKLWSLVIGLVLVLIAGVTLSLSADWSNPNPRGESDYAGQLVLKHESNMTDLYTGTSSRLNLLKKSFAGSSSPSLPSTGQVWYDMTNKLFQIYDGEWGAGGIYSKGTSSFVNIYSSGTSTLTNLVIGTDGTITGPTTTTLYSNCTITADENGGRTIISNGTSTTVTISEANPAVFTKADHGLVEDDEVNFTTTGYLPTNLSSSTTTTYYKYYVLSSGLTTSTFMVAASPSGAAVSTAALAATVSIKTATITIASPAVVTVSSHGLAVHDTVVFSTTGALPTGLTAGTTYYVAVDGFGADSFEVAATPGGDAINTSGTQSGTHTANTPGIITATAHGFDEDDPVVFTTTGDLPTGLSAGTTYYVIESGLGTDSFEVAASVGGVAIRTSGTQSGTHTVNRVMSGTHTVHKLLSFTLPDPTIVPNGYTVDVKNIGSQKTTIVGTVDGSANPTISQYRSISLFSDGLAWYERKAEPEEDEVVEYFANVQTLTSGTTYTPTTGTYAIIVEIFGAGGGGGSGCNCVDSYAGGGGGSGGYAKKMFPVVSATTYAYSIGAGGSGGALVGNGGSGGTTTFTGPGSVTITVYGGGGGIHGNSDADGSGGSAAATSTNGDMNGFGAEGVSGDAGVGGDGAYQSTMHSFSKGGDGGIYSAEGSAGASGRIVVYEFIKQ